MAESSQFNSMDFEDPLADFEPVEYHSRLQWALAEESVHAIQSKPFHRISPTTTIGAAVQEMARLRTASLLVMEGDRVVGIFTERDVLDRVAEQYPKLSSHPVAEVMTQDPTVVYETDPAAAAVASIAVAGHRHVPVLRLDGTLTGVIGPRRVFDFVAHYFDSDGSANDTATEGSESGDV